MLDMFMANADPAAKEVAYWYPKYGDLKTKRPIRVQNMNESGKTYWVEGENIYASRTNVVIRTRYPYTYNPDGEQHIYFRRKWYEITDVRFKDLPKMGLYRQQEYFISLIEVNYGEDFQD